MPPSPCWGISVTRRPPPRSCALCRLRVRDKIKKRKKGVHCLRQWVSESPLDCDFTVSAGGKGPSQATPRDPREASRRWAAGPGLCSCGCFGDRLTSHCSSASLRGGAGGGGGQSRPPVPPGGSVPPGCLGAGRGQRGPVGAVGCFLPFPRFLASVSWSISVLSEPQNCRVRRKGGLGVGTTWPESSVWWPFLVLEGEAMQGQAPRPPRGCGPRLSGGPFTPLLQGPRPLRLAGGPSWASALARGP